MVVRAMQQPAIQAALDNLVEVIRTALTAEFLEFSRGEAKPVGGKLGKAGARKSKAKKAPRRKVAKKSAAQGARKRAAK
jgi:hypothetical protein